MLLFFFLSKSIEVRLIMVTVIVFRLSFISSHSSHCVCCDRLRLLPYFAVVLHSLHTLSIYLLSESSQRICNLPGLLHSFTFWASAIFANFPSAILSTCPAHCSLFLTSSFLYYLAFSPTSTVRPFFSNPLASLP